MSDQVSFHINSVSEIEIVNFLRKCDADFLPPLSRRLNIEDYARKIFNNAMRFEAQASKELIGLIAIYCNDKESCVAYITSVSMLKEWMGRGIAIFLMRKCIDYAKAMGFMMISLEVRSDNLKAIALYKKSQFITYKVDGLNITMNLHLDGGNDHE